MPMYELKNFTSPKNPSTSAGLQPAYLGSRGEHITPKLRSRNVKLFSNNVENTDYISNKVNYLSDFPVDDYIGIKMKN